MKEKEKSKAESTKKFFVQGQGQSASSNTTKF